MRQLIFNIPQDLQKKLDAIATKSKLSQEDIMIKALSDYVESYEDFYHADACSVDQLERSFFLSIGE